MGHRRPLRALLPPVMLWGLLGLLAVKWAFVGLVLHRDRDCWCVCLVDTLLMDPSGSLWHLNAGWRVKEQATQHSRVRCLKTACWWAVMSSSLAVSVMMNV